jgi:predicted DNA-binding protein (UPF0251 family)
MKQSNQEKTIKKIMYELNEKFIRIVFMSKLNQKEYHELMEVIKETIRNELR